MGRKKLMKNQWIKGNERYTYYQLGRDGNHVLHKIRGKNNQRWVIRNIVTGEQDDLPNTDKHSTPEQARGMAQFLMGMSIDRGLGDTVVKRT